MIDRYTVQYNTASREGFSLAGAWSCCCTEWKELGGRGGCRSQSRRIVSTYLGEEEKAATAATADMKRKKEGEEGGVG